MPKYLMQASYTGEGLKGLQKDKASGRRDAVATAFNSVGCRLESFHFAFGTDDVVIILDAPDNVSVAALAITASSSGLVHTKVTPLLTVEEVDKALQKTVNFRPPGR
jgi:uncharacterized protein with GYD domain